MAKLVYCLEWLEGRGSSRVRGSRQDLGAEDLEWKWVCESDERCRREMPKGEALRWLKRGRLSRTRRNAIVVMRCDAVCAGCARRLLIEIEVSADGRRSDFEYSELKTEIGLLLRAL